MHKSSLKNILVGLGALIVVIVGLAYSLTAPGGTYWLFWGLVALVALTLIAGLLFYFFTFSPKKSKRKNPYTQTEAQAIALSMIFQALSDDHLNDEEALMIKGLFEQHTASKLDDEVFNTLVKQARSNYSLCLEEMERLSHSINDQTKMMMITMSLLVLVSDGMIEEDEMRTTLKIAQAIGLSREHTVQIIKDVKHSLEQS